MKSLIRSNRFNNLKGVNRRVVLLLAVGTLLAACRAPQAAQPTQPPAAAPSPTPTKVTLMLDWTPNTNHTGFYVALTKGWYREEGIELEIQQPGATVVPNQVVAERQALFGVSSQEQVTLDRAQGLPIVSIAAIIQHNTSGFASVKEAAIQRPADLAGKRYGAFGLPFEQPFLNALLKCDGADAGTIQTVQLGPTSDYRAMLGREIDFAWIFYAWDGVAAELAGTPYNVIMLSDYTECVPDYYTPLIITSESLMAENPELVRRFMRATARGYQFAISNPDEAAAALLEQVPELQTSADIVKASARWLAPRYQADAPRWGEQKVETWRAFAEFAKQAGIISGEFNAEQAFNTDFLP
ncbi:MAG: ABC transporter substrate-binding protein [Anaerolineae bacterium]|nr:ABC transporter substrate-binding protein [Thermoflexales bacterium]MDW8407557.1 ABC transporter substrate-binding protein [Anaerolineae bacterium]